MIQIDDIHRTAKFQPYFLNQLKSGACAERGVGQYRQIDIAVIAGLSGGITTATMAGIPVYVCLRWGRGNDLRPGRYLDW